MSESTVKGEFVRDLRVKGKRQDPLHVMVVAEQIDDRAVQRDGELVYSKTVTVVQTTGTPVNILGKTIQEDAGISSEDLNHCVLLISVVGIDITSDMTTPDAADIYLVTSAGDDIVTRFASAGQIQGNFTKWNLSETYNNIEADSPNWGATEEHVFFVRMEIWRLGDKIGHRTAIP